MEFLKCRDVLWKGPEKRNKPDVVATTAKHPDSRGQISRYGWMQPTYMRSVSFWGKFTSGSRISASRSDLLKVPNTLARQPLPNRSCSYQNRCTISVRMSKSFHLDALLVITNRSNQYSDRCYSKLAFKLERIFSVVTRTATRTHGMDRNII